MSGTRTLRPGKRARSCRILELTPNRIFSITAEAANLQASRANHQNTNYGTLPVQIKNTENELQSIRLETGEK